MLVRRTRWVKPVEQNQEVVKCLNRLFIVYIHFQLPLFMLLTPTQK